MRLIRLAIVLASAVGCAGCFEMTTVLKIGGDGAGTIEHRMVFTPQALKQLALLAGTSGKQVDPLSEQQARDMASVLGEGVTFVSSTPITTPVGQGRDAIYAFTDVNKLKISTLPPTPGGVAVRAGGISTEGEGVTFSLTHEASGSTVLHINVPEPGWLDSLGTPNGASQFGMITKLLAGAHVLLAAEPTGALVRTSSPFVDGSRVTLLEIDLAQIMKDETLLPRLQAADSSEARKSLIKNASGLKINFDREITLEFTPAR
jgi:hypothetical protein